MEPEVQLSRPRSKKKTKILIILAAFIVLMLAAAGTFTGMVLQNDNAYKGIRIGSLDASGMSRDGLKKALDAEYQSVADRQTITVKSEKAEITVGFPDIGVRYDTQAAVDAVFAIGRTGTVFDRLYDIGNAGMNGIALDVPQTYNKEKVDALINDFYSRTLVHVSEGELLVAENSVTIRSGHHGENIDKAKTLELVTGLIKDCKSGTVEPEIIVTRPAKFNVDELYKQIVSEPEDASYRVENSQLVLQPHKIGRGIDKAQLEAIVAELEKTESTERLLPVTFSMPKITTEIAAASLFKDELAAWHTSFSTGTENGKNRGFNIGLSVAKIDGMVLAPGETFSYNDVVGPRDLAHGFKIAHVYSAGKIIDGVGGGICQVSSTMYSAILRADLEIVERRNHSFTVGYVTPGQDATAYYGGTDFKFKNSTKWPIKILASVKNNKIYVSLMGTNDNPGKTVIISSKTLSETPYTVKYIDDPTLSAGTTKEILPGLNGIVVETYKTIKQDGKVVSQTKLHTSTYKMYPQDLLRGTKPVAGTAQGGTAAGGAAGAAAGNSTAGSGSAVQEGSAAPVEVPVDEAPDGAEQPTESGAATDTAGSSGAELPTP
jgi:vancomycin resistance protein YoaR